MEIPNDTLPGYVDPPAMRARFILEAAAGMAAHPDEPYCEPELTLQTLSGGPPVRLSATSTADGINRVVAGEVDLAFINPSSALTAAYRGKGSYFTQSQPVRAVTVLPSRDQCLFVVHGSTGLATIEDIGRAKYPLKLALRGRERHLLHNMLDDIVAAAGFSLADIVAWGVDVQKTGHIPEPETAKFQALAKGELTAVFDEGVQRWANAVTPAGLTALKFGDETLARLEEIGYRRDFLTRDRCPTLPEDIPTLDFSGWPVLVRDDADGDMIRRVCAGLEARRAMIPWEGAGPLLLDIMCQDTPEAPLGVPFHPAAEAFWKQQGYL